MAIINIERLEQLKKEKEIQSGIRKTAFALWVDGVNNRTKALSSSLVDILDTYAYFVKNKLDLSVFKVEGNHFHLAYQKSNMSIDKGVARHVCIHCNASNGRIWINTYFGGIDYKSLHDEYHAKQVYDNAEMKNLVESFVLDLEQYCAIITDRLKNL